MCIQGEDKGELAALAVVYNGLKHLSVDPPQEMSGDDDSGNMELESKA